MSTSSEHIDHLVDDYWHDLLSRDQAARVEDHVAECPRCRVALDKANRRLGLLRALPPVEPSLTLVPETLDRIEEMRNRQQHWRSRLTLGIVGSLVAILLLLLGSNLYYQNLKANPIDLLVLGQRDLLAATTASLRVRLVNRGNQSMLAGVPVVITLIGPGQTQQLASFETDAVGNGSPRIQVPDWPEGTYQLNITARTSSGTENLTRQVTIKRSWKLMLSSDRPVYQPGQTILLRALALRRPDLKPVADQPATFTLTDPRGNVLFKHLRPTSKFGLTHAECELSTEIQEGAYTIACRVGDTESKLTVEVKRYVLPKFKIEVTPDRPYYAPGQEARIALTSSYFFGKAIDKGTVELRLIGRTPGDPVLETFQGVFDSQGKSELRVPLPMALPGREQDGGDARVGFLATVTDAAGQKQSRLVERLVTTRPVRVEVLPEAGRLVLGQENIVHVLVHRADGSPVPGLNVEVTGDQIGGKFSTDERGTGSFRVTPTMREMSYVLRASDATGNVLARRADKLRVGDSPDDFLVRTDRATYQAGQSMHLEALATPSLEPIFLDLIKDGQSFLSDMIDLQGGKGERTIDLPPDLFGTVRLVAYRFVGHSGLPLRKERIVYIAPADALRLEAELDRKEYRPGEQARLNLRLTDTRGVPTPGAISLQAVDEAVFSVLPQRPGLEQAFYTLEQELLKPVYALYPWSFEDTPAEAPRDRALFAATARQDAAPVISAGAALSPGGAHTLAATTLPGKRQHMEQMRQNGLALVRTGWWGLAGLTALALYSLLWLYLSLSMVLKVHLHGGFLLLTGSVVFMALFSLAPQSKNTFMHVGSRIGAGNAPGGADRVSRFNMNAPRPDVMDAALAEKAPTSRTPKPGQPVRVRDSFPETLLWKPELITDDQGRLAPVEIGLADSITTWRLSASAVAADGRLGAMQKPLRVFQPFFVDLDLPVSLTRGDEVGMPVVVYNYLDSPQTVKLTLSPLPWFTLRGPAEQQLDLKPGEVRSIRYTLTVGQVGLHRLRVTAQAGAVGDAIERTIEVVPDGQRIEKTFSGSLDSPATLSLEVPTGTVPGSVKALVKLYPSSFSQLVEGLDGIFQMPSGCFEQTSSTTYPNVLALDYLRRNKLSVPAVEAKARQYIHLGYQRLVGFEVPGGGFDWYGRAPASLVLSAYGLMEFTDMARVHEVDPNLLTRTRDWLLRQRKPDGAWEFEPRTMHLAGSSDPRQARLAVTAYVARAIFADGQAIQHVGNTLDYLLAHSPGDIKDPQTLAQVCLALHSLAPESSELPAYFDRLAELATKSADGKLIWWEQSAQQRTLFFGAGQAGNVETTALAVQALVSAKRQPQMIRGALAWLVASKDGRGTWHSTQATVQALKALLSGTGQAVGDGAREVEIAIGGHLQTLGIPADQAEVMKILDVSKHVREGVNRAQLTERTKSAAGYQVVLSYHLPVLARPKEEPLTIRLEYDRSELAVGDTLKARVTVTNRQTRVAPMVMLDLPVPPGFAPSSEEFTRLVEEQKIGRFQVRPRQVIVYLRGLEPGKPLTLEYSLRATMPVKATTPAARVYEYYDPHKEATTGTGRVTVKE